MFLIFQKKKENIENTNSSKSLKNDEKQKKIDEKKSKITKINQNEIYENNFILYCYQCQNMPKILLKDKEEIFLTCINCGKSENEQIEKIIKCSSKWMKKILYYCIVIKEKLKLLNFAKNVIYYYVKNVYIPMKIIMN